ncbi:proteasome core particle subunit beta 2 [Ceratobasidium sp. 414]|nr:proteasome core particle subunit beta 2 [Ceratobasidium sp. 414]
MVDVYLRPGFDFSNTVRNEFLAGKGIKVPKATSTGTTIVGCLFADGIVLGADTRATEGDIVADKNCEKIHYIAPHIRCCGAGTAADTEFTTALISSNIELHELSHVGAALVLGGVDSTGPHLFTVAPHGSTDKLPYVTMGSGSLAAMAVFESQWKAGLSRDEAVDLVSAAISAGIFNDLGSGSNVDVCVITASGTQMLRNHKTDNVRATKEHTYKFPRGTTAWKHENIRSLVVEEVVRPAGGDAMDTT